MMENYMFLKMIKIRNKIPFMKKLNASLALLRSLNVSQVYGCSIHSDNFDADPHCNIPLEFALFG